MSTACPDIAIDLRAPPPPGAGNDWALFLDVDGTLLDFAPHPDDVEVNARLPHDIARLRARLNGAVALLSGRQLPQLDALFDWQGHAAAGLHGAELRMPDGQEHVLGDDAGFGAVRTQARRLVDATPGVMLEDKQRALALHYRRAPAVRAAAEGIAERLLHAAGGGYALQRGDHVIELKPAGVNKGGALAALMATAPFRGRRPWMLGDDLTDEEAFHRVNALGGISVIVGERRPTEASHALADPAAVRAWLHAQAVPDPG